MPAFKKGEVWKAIDTAAAYCQRLLLYGPSGTGKTHFATLAGLREKEEVYQITLTPDTPAAALIGHFVIKGGDCVWSDGVGVAAWRASRKRPSRLVINEVDHAGPDAISALHVLLDDQVTAGMTLATGEDVAPGNGLRIVGTMNGLPEDLLPSLQDRFTVRVRVDEVHPEAIKMLPSDLQYAAANTVASEDPMRRVSVRAWHSFASLRSDSGDEELSAKCVFGDRWQDVLNALKVGKK